MAKLSSSQRAFLLGAARDYAADLEDSGADQYLADRGIDAETATRFGLGYVGDPHLGHEMYRGMIAIPYLRWADDKHMSVVAIRFRCIEPACPHAGHGKYNTTAGDRPRLYNTKALQMEDDRVAITEGEFDAVVASSIGLPAVSVPGATSWQKHFREPFLGYETVYILADGDDPGMVFAETIARTLPNAKIIPSPPGDDVSSLVLREGPDALLGRIR